MIALNAEHVYLLLVIGICLTILVVGIRNRRIKNEGFNHKKVIFSIGLSLVFVILQGGVISGIARNFIFRNGGNLVSGLGTAGFIFQWPPAFISTNFKPLSLLNPAQMIVGLADMGPAILLIPIVLFWIWKCGKRGHIIEAGLGLAGFIGVILPFFIHYGVERDTSRITGFGLQVFIIVSIPALMFFIKHGKAIIQGMIVWGFGLSILGGIVNFAILFTAITTPQITYFVDPLDARMSHLEWDLIEPGSLVLDRIPYRAVTLFGRLTDSSPASGSRNINTSTEWQALIANPDPMDVAKSGYQYIYMDNTWWHDLDPDQQSNLDQSCIQIIHEIGDQNSTDWRKLLDVSKCK
jgi:hypothetical protein